MPPANHCAAFPQEESLLATGGTTKNVQGMLRQDALQVRGPLPIANAQSTQTLKSDQHTLQTCDHPTRTGFADSLTTTVNRPAIPKATSTCSIGAR